MLVVSISWSRTIEGRRTYACCNELGVIDVLCRNTVNANEVFKSDEVFQRCKKMHKRIYLLSINRSYTTYNRKHATAFDMI